MFYQASPLIFERAKALRMKQTPAEKKLWEVLQKNQMLGLRFKRQHPVAHFIADFYCHPIKLSIEVDGSIHDLEEIREKDRNRTVALENLGIEVIRFTNDEIFNNFDAVTKTIETKCTYLIEGLPTPLPPKGSPHKKLAGSPPSGGRGQAWAFSIQ